jgi:hypothetical protein
MPFLEGDNGILLVINSESPKLDCDIEGCKGELMDHQNRTIKAIVDFEESDCVDICSHNGDSQLWTNHLRIEMKMGSGKTKLAIGIVLASPKPKKKPVFVCQNNMRMRRIYKDNRVIDPTLIVVRHSIYFQYVAQIDEFSNLRVFQVRNSRSLVKFAKLINEDLQQFNRDYDVVLVNYKTVSGNLDYVLDKCDCVLRANANKTKRIHLVLFNMLSGFYVRRIIYDDWDMMNIKLAPIENAGSCIRMSATCQTIMDIRGYPFSKYNAAADLHNPCYTFASHKTVKCGIPCITVDSEFLSQSIEMGLPNAPGSMMPAAPIVYMYSVSNAENDAINIISELSTDEKILESVNNLSNSSPGTIIKSLFADRFDDYKKAQRIVTHYEKIDIDALDDLPEPPEGAFFQRANIEALEPIEYKYRTIVARVKQCVENAKTVVTNETNTLARIKVRIRENTCPICFERVSDEPAAIMLCCNNIMHVRCVLKCHSKTCAMCRSQYGRTFADTFVCLHHDTDVNELLDASLDSELEQKNADESKQNYRPTKISIAKQIIMGIEVNAKRADVELCKLKSIIFDDKSEAKCIDKNRKVLMYCSADETLRKIGKELYDAIAFSRLTKSSKSTYNKVTQFRNAKTQTAILANSWSDAAGIDFNMATDIIVFNYIDSPYVLQQMFGRTFRVGQKHRVRIHIVAYENEQVRWLNTYVKPAPSSN